MNREQYFLLVKRNETVLVPKLFTKNLEDRTLIFGCDTNSDLRHTYLFKKKIYVCIHDRRERIIGEKRDIVNYIEFLPTLRLYPECCDYEFCSFLKEKGFNLSFSLFNSSRPKEKFYGKIIQNGVLCE